MAGQPELLQRQGKVRRGGRLQLGQVQPSSHPGLGNIQRDHGIPTQNDEKVSYVLHEKHRTSK